MRRMILVGAHSPGNPEDSATEPCMFLRSNFFRLLAGPSHLASAMGAGLCGAGVLDRATRGQLLGRPLTTHDEEIFEREQGDDGKISRAACWRVARSEKATDDALLARPSMPGTNRAPTHRRRIRGSRWRDPRRPKSAGRARVGDVRDRSPSSTNPRAPYSITPLR